MPSDREIRRLLLSGLVADIHKRSRGTYGMLRIRAALEREQGMVVNKKLILSIMRELGIKGFPGPKKRKKNLVNEATEEDLVQRNFTVDRPNVLWLTDITEHPTREGKVYCCVVLDAFSRRVVGWAIDRRCQSALVNDAVAMASDVTLDRAGLDHPLGPRVSQFTSWGFSELDPHQAPRRLHGHHRRLLRQRPHGVVLGLDADRAAQPQEVADQDRAVDRHGRVDRALLQSRAAPQLARLRPTDRVRGLILQHPSRPDSYKPGPGNGVKVKERPVQRHNKCSEGSQPKVGGIPRKSHGFSF